MSKPNASEFRSDRWLLLLGVALWTGLAVVVICATACTASDARDVSGAGSIAATISEHDSPEAAAALAASEIRFEEVRVAMEERRAAEIAAGHDPGPIGHMPLREWVYGALGVALPGSDILASRQRRGLEPATVKVSDLIQRAVLKIALLRADGKSAKEIALELQRDGLTVVSAQVELLGPPSQN